MATRDPKDEGPTRPDAFDDEVRRSGRWWEGLLPMQRRGWMSDVPASTLQRRLFAALMVLAGVAGAVYSWRAEGSGISFVLSVIVAVAGIALGLARAGRS